MSLLFVYGTLMRGGCRAAALAREQFVSLAHTEPRYRLYDCGSYPGLVEVEPGSRVHGELWRVRSEHWPALDEIEGVTEGIYARRLIRLLSPAVKEPVEAYFYLPETTQLRAIGDRWLNPG